MKKLLFYTYAKNKDIKNTSCICSKIAIILILTCALLSEFLSCHEGRVSQFLWHQQGVVQIDQYLKLYLIVGFIITTFIHLSIKLINYMQTNVFLKKYLLLHAAVLLLLTFHCMVLKTRLRFLLCF